VAHKVKFALPQRELGRANIEFLVYQSGQVIGSCCLEKTVARHKKWKSKRGKARVAFFHWLMHEYGPNARGG
jgi:hypothetical protein